MATSTRTDTYYDLADCPEDGGKHALYCYHEGVGTSNVQDTNKRRLMEWLPFPEQWCCFCQEETNNEEDI